jgi:hypothetical protein
LQDISGASTSSAARDTSTRSSAGTVSTSTSDEQRIFQSSPRFPSTLAMTSAEIEASGITRRNKNTALQAVARIAALKEAGNTESLLKDR